MSAPYYLEAFRTTAPDSADWICHWYFQPDCNLLFFQIFLLIIIAQKSITGVDSFPASGDSVLYAGRKSDERGGIARRLVNFFDALIGHVTGGLGMVTIIVCMFFAAISGSAVATVSAVGAFMIPEMVDHGYNKPFSAR